MSQASDMLAEVKQSLTDVTKEIKSFEGDFEELGHFTDLAHLNIATIHLGELLGSLRNRRENAEDAELAAMEAEEAAAAAPSAPSGSTLSETTGMRPLTEADLVGEPEPGSEPAPPQAPVENSAPAEPDPAAGLVEKPEAPAA